ncbi:protein ELFN1-like [Cetorhinus maximus]
MALHSFTLWVSLASLFNAAGVYGDCWLIEGEKGFVWLAICSQNQPPYESIPQHINSTIVDLRLNENKIKSVQYSSLNRFGNLTELNLTKNQISYIEDGAFSAQYNLRVLQLGFNKLRNITEGILRGLGRLEYLYLQANLIEVVSPNSFWECPNVMNIDLSMNRLQTLESSTFLGLGKLTTCELYGNPFYCSCNLLGFLKWLVQFNNTTRSYDRTQCTSPSDFAGYLLLNQGHASSKDALSVLASMCNEDLYSIDPRFIFTQKPSTTTVPESPCEAEDCPSGEESTPLISFQTPFMKVDDTPVIKLKEITYTTATLMVHIPSPIRKENILVQYNNSMYTDIKNLATETEEIKIEELIPHTNYTYCVTSIHNLLRYNQTCVTFSTRAKTITKPLPAASNTTHYIMTILGCLFGIVIILGVIYYCLRKKKEEQVKNKKSGNAKKTIIELKYAPELETITITQMAQKPVPPSDIMSSRMPFLPSAGDLEEYNLQEVIESPKLSRGNYMDVRTGEHPYHRDILESMFGESQDSAAEISTIAKEVDQVNLIINNCIDALQTETSSFRGPSARAMASVEPQDFLVAEQSQGKSGFLSPIYRESYHPLKRHSSMDAAPKCPSISSNCSMRSPRSVRSDIYAGPRYKSEAKYIERTSPTRSAILTGTPCRIVRSETTQMQPYSDHSHLYAGLHHGERKQVRSPSPCVLEALPRSRSRRNLAYSQFSPQYHSVSYASSPEYSSKPSKGVWERYKPHEKWHRKDEYLAAGYALRKKVQFATDEDLHDILDYWKGVSSQHKS